MCGAGDCYRCRGEAAISPEMEAEIAAAEEAEEARGEYLHDLRRERDL